MGDFKLFRMTDDECETPLADADEIGADRKFKLRFNEKNVSSDESMDEGFDQTKEVKFGIDEKKLQKKNRIILKRKGKFYLIVDKDRLIGANASGKWKKRLKSVKYASIVLGSMINLRNRKAEHFNPKQKAGSNKARCGFTSKKNSMFLVKSFNSPEDFFPGCTTAEECVWLCELIVDKSSNYFDLCPEFTTGGPANTVMSKLEDILWTKDSGWNTELINEVLNGINHALAKNNEV